MKFDKLQIDTDCDCLKGAKEDTNNFYIRKISNNKITPIDFHSKWENGIFGESKNCNDICNYKGVSLDKYSDQNFETIKKKYIRNFKINPGRAKYLVKFKLKKNSGMIKQTRTKYDLTHVNLFKSDKFSIDSIIESCIIKLTNDNV